MSDRRSFFKSIAGLFVVAKTAPALLLGEAKPGLAFHRDAFSAAAIDLPLPTQMQMLTEYMHRELVALLPGFPEVEAAHSFKMCAEFPHLFTVDMAMDPNEIELLSDEAVHMRYIEPITRGLAREVLAKKATRFAELRRPMGLDHSAIVTGSGISIRGIRGYDIAGYTTWNGEPGWVMRFDILFR